MEITTSQDSSFLNENVSLLNENHVSVSKMRWLMLFIFSLNIMLDGMLSYGLSPLTNIVAVYYNVKDVSIEWSANMFFMVYVLFSFFASYIISRLGVKKSLLIVSALHTITTIFHIKSHKNDQYWVYLIGQIPAAFAYSFVLQLTPLVSASWFPLRERASTTSLGAFSYGFGSALEFVLTTNVVKNINMEIELRTLFQCQLIMAVVILILTVALYREKPENPPSLLTESNENRDLSFFESLKKLATDRNFVFMSQSYGIYFGLAITLSMLINPLLTSKFPTGHVKIIGWLGFAFLIISYLPTFFLGIWLDRYSSYRGVSIMLNLFSMGAWLLFTLLFLQTAEFIALFSVYIILGLLAQPFMYIGPEHAAEMTFPVKESTSTAFITILGNLYSFVFVFSIGTMAQDGYLKASCFTIFTLYVISSIFSVLSKTELRRHNANRVESDAADSTL